MTCSFSDIPESKRCFIAQSLSCSPFHRLEMTEILVKGRKTLTHPSISDIDECDTPFRCSEHANCTNTPGSFSCTCMGNYQGDGFTCHCEYQFLNVDCFFRLAMISQWSLTLCHISAHVVNRLLRIVYCAKTGSPFQIFSIVINFSKI